MNFLYPSKLVSLKKKVANINQIFIYTLLFSFFSTHCLWCLVSSQEAQYALLKDAVNESKEVEVSFIKNLKKSFDYDLFSDGSDISKEKLLQARRKIEYSEKAIKLLKKSVFQNNQNHEVKAAIHSSIAALKGSLSKNLAKFRSENIVHSGFPRNKSLEVYEAIFDIYLKTFESFHLKEDHIDQILHMNGIMVLLSNIKQISIKSAEKRYVAYDNIRLRMSFNKEVKCSIRTAWVIAQPKLFYEFRDYPVSATLIQETTKTLLPALGISQVESSSDDYPLEDSKGVVKSILLKAYEVFLAKVNARRDKSEELKQAIESCYATLFEAIDKLPKELLAKKVSDSLLSIWINFNKQKLLKLTRRREQGYKDLVETCTEVFEYAAKNLPSSLWGSTYRKLIALFEANHHHNLFKFVSNPQFLEAIRTVIKSHTFEKGIAKMYLKNVYVYLVDQLLEVKREIYLPYQLTSEEYKVEIKKVFREYLDVESDHLLPMVGYRANSYFDYLLSGFIKYLLWLVAGVSIPGLGLGLFIYYYKKRSKTKPKYQLFLKENGKLK